MSGRWIDAALPVHPAWPCLPDRRPEGPSRPGVRQSAVDGVACSYRSPTLRYTQIGPFERGTTAPEDLWLNGQHVAVFFRIPRFGQLPLKRLHAPFDECRILGIADVGQAQHRRCFAQLAEEHVDAWPPLHADVRRTWLESRIRQVHGHNAI